MKEMHMKLLEGQSFDGDNQLIVGLSGTAKGYVLSQIFKQIQKPMVYVADNMLHATQIYDDLQMFLPNTPIYQFATEETAVAEFATSSYDLLSQRIDALHFLLTGNAGVVITSVSGVRKRLTPRDIFMNMSYTLTHGQDIDLTNWTKTLALMGYIRRSMVESPGEFSVRGGIIDVFPLSYDYPIRIELFDTEIDSMRLFNPETQTSIETIETVTILPATDMIVTDETRDSGLQAMLGSLNEVLPTISDEMIKNSTHTFFTNLIERLKQGELPENIRLYAEYFYQKATSVCDYLSSDGVIVLDEYVRLIEQDKQLAEDDAHFIVHKSRESILLPTQEINVSLLDVLKNREHRRLYFANMQKGLGRLKFSSVVPFQYRSMPQFFSQMPLIKSEMERFEKQHMTVIVVVFDKKRAEKVSQTFSDFDIQNSITTLDNIQEAAVNIVVGAIHNGFELPQEKIVFLNERELFNKVTKTVAKRQNLTNAERLKSYSELTKGDFVVHVNHGVGKYVGMETMEISGIKQDYMSIIYQDDAQLFIPVTQIHLVQKYVASDGKDPKLNKLGGSEWAKTKKKVAKKIEDIADELIALYAKRESEVGYAFSKDTTDQKDFENAFPYAETADQLRSVEEIKKDMELAKPMDRLLVGDVGYGKTEVAMRAIFKAVQDGKQVAFLVPTTILAQQHYMTLTQRFEDYPINIALMSRFRSKAQQTETVEQLKQGKVDIVVGTHRLVSKDIVFSDLGLLVIDEEQRFGVKHKERLKQLKTQVDVLTLTATPIPRTLHMSMLGVRDLSVIETPPANRYPVQTYVIEQDMGIVRDAIERELARDGQVFYLYNRVETIEQKAEHIRQLVPHARIAHAHGQMSENELEQILLDFMGGEYDVLVTTTIIETGVDLPNVNTLFIEDADRMGLSQLYQLRGRVGRTNRIAYAYFMHQPDKMLTETGEKRLSAIKEFTQLGAGFKIAMRDLSIRGAGNLLGQQQSGFIDSVGFDLYTEMLKDAVAFKRTGKEKSEALSTEIDLAITAYIPSYYVEDERQKIDIYKRIKTIGSVADYRSIQDDLIDRFGDYPDEVSDLVNIGLLKYYAQKQGVEKIKRQKENVSVTYTLEKSAQLTGAMIFEQLGKTKLKASVQQEQQKFTVSFKIQSLPIYLWLEELQKYLKTE